MGRGGTGLDDEAERQERDAYLLENGKLPAAVTQRLAEVGRGGGAGLAFTSDLAPDEAALLRRHGFSPICLVTGSAMYHVGIAYASSWNDCEVSVLSRAYGDATGLAAGRLALEARSVGADGVVGVRYTIVRHEWAERTVEVRLIGTAVKGPGAGGPWLSDLSGQEWWALWRAGYEPSALVYGHCTWFVLTTIADVWNENNPQNVELGHFSDALSQCRIRAAGRMTAMAREAGATGVVGVRMARRVDEVRLEGSGGTADELEHHNVILSMIGTAIRPRPGAPRRVPATGLAISLRTGRLVAAETRNAARFL